MLAWVQNERLENVRYWLEQAELPEHAFRKRYMWLWWDTSQVVVGMPIATDQYTAEDLLIRGIVGLYAERRDG